MIRYYVSDIVNGTQGAPNHAKVAEGFIKYRDTGATPPLELIFQQGLLRWFTIISFSGSAFKHDWCLVVIDAPTLVDHQTLGQMGGVDLLPAFQKDDAITSEHRTQIATFINRRSMDQAILTNAVTYRDLLTNLLTQHHTGMTIADLPFS